MCKLHHVRIAFEPRELPDKLFGTRKAYQQSRSIEKKGKPGKRTCCDNRVLDDSGVIPQAESSTTTLDVGMAWADLREAQVRIRERMRELRCMLRTGNSKRRGWIGDGHGSSVLYKSGGG